HVRGAHERAVEAVGPGMVRALDPTGEVSGAGLAESRPTVPADVEESAEPIVLAPDEDEALARGFEKRVIAGRRQSVRPAGAEPALGEDGPRFAREDLRRNVVLAGERRHRLREDVAFE